MGAVHAFNRTLEQELNALVRGASLECLVCGEFVMRIGGAVFCPECRSQLSVGAALGAASETVDLGGS
jgi:Zn finger protein HypA/HybF involved in hydrogenase expression